MEESDQWTLNLCCCQYHSYILQNFLFTYGCKKAGTIVRAKPRDAFENGREGGSISNPMIHHTNGLAAEWLEGEYCGREEHCWLH